jgi:predicted dehydrogenase
MRVGILGTGFGAFHASIYKQQSEIESITIFGRNESKLDGLKEKYNIDTTTEINDILTDPTIDLIDVCLPSDLHREYVIEALKHGKDVFCETPVSFTLADAIAMRDAARQYNRKLFVNLFIKCAPEYTYIHEAMHANMYGKLKAIHVTRKTAPLWGDLGLKKITTALAIHDLDFITWLLGAPTATSVEGIMTSPHESHVHASLRYADTIVELTGSSMMPKSYPFTVSYEAIFEEGSVEYHEYGSDQESGRSLVAYTANGREELTINPADSYVIAIQHVIDCCKNNTETLFSIEDAIRALEVSIQLKDLLHKS